ncbi:MAG: carboxypeptidase regulatory-like domain-containing protein [Acidobacteria bacterium]|nr:carboxypeptidase regulatory-like domain-containing protein [Acidobacteriota bacterium]
MAPYLTPGTYQLKATKSGFQTVVRQNVALHVADRLTIDLQLPVQTEQTLITVTEQAPLVETENTAHAQTVTQNQVEALPIAARRWENFVLLTPAVTTNGNSGLSSFRGISGLYNGNSVDGANNTQAFFSEAWGRAIIVSYVYSADSIREFQVASSNYSAERRSSRRRSRQCGHSIRRQPPARRSFL